MESWQIFITSLEILAFGYLYWLYNKNKRLVNEESQVIIDDARKEAIKITENAYKEKTNLEKELESVKTKIDNYELDLVRSNLLQDNINKLNSEIATAESNLEQILLKHSASETKHKQKLKFYKDALIRAQDVLRFYFVNYGGEVNHQVIISCIKDLENIVPTVELPLKAIEYSDLKIKFKENQKHIEDTLSRYESRYTTKTNRAVYQLMVISLRSELQNILFNLKYTNLDKSLSAVEDVVQKYISIASDGNQSIKPTAMKFIGEIEMLFKKAVNIEYEYYVRQAKIKEEQQLLKDRMKQEALELKQLAIEREKLLKEESKFNAEIASIKEKLEQTIEEGTIFLLKQRIQELEKQLADVSNKKEQIIDLQNGKAGYVYIISNLGSFGDKMFKVGMTRRLNPQDRIDELGDASVPFKFDVHSFIFSEDAVALEMALHKRLESQRVNKMTLRKEFFYSTVDELEKLVFEIQPTAAFSKTMLAEQYRQSLSIEKQNN